MLFTEINLSINSTILVLLLYFFSIVVIGVATGYMVRFVSEKLV